jgi:hypothetical protein
MVRDRQHGPVIELNRIQVKRSRSKGGLAGPDGMKSVFGQMVSKMSLLTQEALFLPHRVWKVKFVGKKYVGVLEVPYFPVDNVHLMFYAHPVFSVLTNFFNRYRAPYVYRAPEKCMESYDWLWPGPYLGILRPWAQENVPPLICSYSVMCKKKNTKN